MEGVTEPSATEHFLPSAISNQPTDRAAGQTPRSIERLDRLKTRDEGIQRRGSHPPPLPAIAASHSPAVASATFEAIGAGIESRLRELEIRIARELREAAAAGRLRDVPAIGPKTEAQIRRRAALV
jgi:hypothetical protein